MAKRVEALDHRFTVRVAGKEYSMLCKLCERRKQSISQVIREAILKDYAEDEILLAKKRSVTFEENNRLRQQRRKEFSNAV